jgi:pimeloyl-ACP methyl ester carboxylesterase
LVYATPDRPEYKRYRSKRFPGGEPGGRGIKTGLVSIILHNKIKGSQLEIFEDAGHVLLWTHSKRLAGVVKNFLE